MVFANQLQNLKKKNTIGDGGNTALYTAYIGSTVNTVVSWNTAGGGNYKKEGVKCVLPI